NNPVTSTLIIPAAQVPNLTGAYSLVGMPVVVQHRPDNTAAVDVSSDPIYLEWQSSRFVDVPQGSPFYDYIEPMAQKGVVSGFIDGTFRPNDVGMRGHISKMVVLASGWSTDTTGGPHFADVPATSPFYAYVETAYNRGIISGYSDGTFRPYNSITRGQL